ncbi:hypothetical protein CDAR_204921 [Caerostris darwini]|uniref:Uncharacterized protein n=1 Tax=Caerostris darwini TaxID=1538125 RepID=A0AAV4PBR9_9ARAC|nr:hypothetical protein CDAR_204921 [Caerostris darwini]
MRKHLRLIVSDLPPYPLHCPPPGAVSSKNESGHAPYFAEDGNSEAHLSRFRIEWTHSTFDPGCKRLKWPPFVKVVFVRYSPSKVCITENKNMGII